MAGGIDPAVASHLNKALSTLIAHQPSAAVPEILRLQAALREHEQIPVNTIEALMEAASTDAPPSTSIPEPTITAQVHNLFKPFTMSAAMKVRINGQSQPAFLKLFDRRFSSVLRIDDQVPTWTAQREANYHDFIRSGDAQKFVNYLNHDDQSSVESFKELPWTTGQEEAFLQDKCHDLYKTELAAYHALSPLQGICIPKLLGGVVFQPFPDADPEIQDHTAVRGLLLSYIPGFRLDQLARHVPRNQWQGVCDAAVRAVNACSDLGILNEDVRPENCVVRCVQKVSAEEGEGEVVYRPFIIDFAAARLRRLDESDGEWREAKREVNEEGAMGAALMRDLKSEYKIGGYIYDPRRVNLRMRVEELTGAGRTRDEEVDVWDEQRGFREREDTIAYPQAFLVDEHDDLESEDGELALEEIAAETDGGFDREYSMSPAESRAMGVHVPDEDHSLMFFPLHMPQNGL